MISSAKKIIIAGPTANAHASCIARVNRETWVTWFGGTKEGDNDVDIYLSRETAEGWTDPVRITADETLPHWNPVLLPHGDGAILYFKLGPTITGWKTMHVTLGPDGTPIDEIRELVPGDIGGRGPVRNKCLTLPDGRVLAPASVETPEPTCWKDASCAGDVAALPERDQPLRWKPLIDISYDGGETFTRACPVPLFKGENESSLRMTPSNQPNLDARAVMPCFARGLGAIQPSLWQAADGKIKILLRSSEGFVLRSESEDGENWSPAAMTSIPNNNSGIDLVKMDDGRVLLCLNPISGDWAARTPLNLYISSDDGDTFRPLMTLEMNEGEYSYPSLAAEGNTIYLSYTWNRLKIAVWKIELDPLSR